MDVDPVSRGTDALSDGILQQSVQERRSFTRHEDQHTSITSTGMRHEKNRQRWLAKLQQGGGGGVVVVGVARQLTASSSTEILCRIVVTVYGACKKCTPIR